MFARSTACRQGVGRTSSPDVDELEVSVLHKKRASANAVPSLRDIDVRRIPAA
jgi:hypothetical protein